MKKWFLILVTILSSVSMAEKSISYEEQFSLIREKRTDLVNLRKSLKEAQLHVLGNVIKVSVSTMVITMLFSKSNSLMAQRNLYALAEGTALRIGATGIAIYGGFKGWDLYLNVQEIDKLSEQIDFKLTELIKVQELMTELQ